MTDMHDPLFKSLKRWNLALITTLLAATVVIVSRAFQPAVTVLFSEKGGVEIATVIVLTVLAFLLFIGTWKTLLTQWHWPLSAVFLLLRENDFHDWFFEPGLLHIGLLTGNAQLWQKAIGVVVMAIILVTFSRVAIKGSRPFMSGLLAGASWAWLLMAALCLVAIATQIDGIGRGTTYFGMTPGPGMVLFVGIVEEAIELLFALLLVWSLQAWVRLDD